MVRGFYLGKTLSNGFLGAVLADYLIVYEYKNMKEGSVMEKELREHLLEDEQLLWSGCPEPFDTFDKTNKNSLIVGLVIKILVTLGIAATFYISAQGKGDVKPGVFIFIFMFAVFAVINPFMIARRLRGKTIYGLTDKRIIRAGAKDEAVPYERIKRAVLRKDKDGRTSLLCGPRAVNLKPRQWRGEADASFINIHDEPEADRVILFALPMDEQLKILLTEHLPLN